MSAQTFRRAVINADLCQPKKCKQECKKSCPVVAQGKACIEVTPQDAVALRLPVDTDNNINKMYNDY